MPDAWRSSCTAARSRTPGARQGSPRTKWRRSAALPAPSTRGCSRGPRHLRLHRRRSPAAARGRRRRHQDRDRHAQRAGGVEGYKIKAIYADAQSKTDVAINEAERLLEQEKVDLIMGVYSSAHCVPMAQRVDAAKKFMWANVCVASACSRTRTSNTCSARRCTPTSSARPPATSSPRTRRRSSASEVKDLKVAIIHEDGPYGAGVAQGNEASASSSA